MLPSVNNHAASQISLSRYSGSEAGLAYTPIQAERQSSDRPQAQMLRVAASRAPSSVVSAGLRTSASVLLFTFRSCSLSVPNIAIDEVPWFSSSSCSCIISASALSMPQQQKYLHDCCSLLISSLTPGIYPDPPPRGGYNPPVFMRHPQPSEVQRGLSGGVYGGVFM